MHLLQANLPNFIFLQGHNHSTDAAGMSIDQWFSLLELPFLLICIYYAFKTASALKGGAFGKGMTLMAWGFLVMAVGHLNMQLMHHFDFDIFSRLFGNLGGKIAWFVALVITWALSGLGFYSIYNVSKAKA